MERLPSPLLLGAIQARAKFAPYANPQRKQGLGRLEEAHCSQSFLGYGGYGAKTAMIKFRKYLISLENSGSASIPIAPA